MLPHTGPNAQENPREPIFGRVIPISSSTKVPGACPSAVPTPLSETEMGAWQVLRQLSIQLEDLLAGEVSDRTDLSASEYGVLMSLADAEATRLRMTALAKETHLSPSRLSHTVERLEERGLVDRVSCPKDRRGVECSLSAAGLKLLQDSAEEHFEQVRSRVLSLYSEEELGNLTGLLRRLVS